jgi:Ca2+-binding EF-hand superfamily protein
MYQYQPEMRVSNPLTDDQKSALSEIISQYDPSNMTESDKKSMMGEIKNLGIGPSDEVKEIMDSAGFKPSEMRPPEGSEGPRRPDKNEIPEEILDILQQREEGKISEEDFESFLQNLQKTLESSSGVYLDTTA